MSGYPYGHGMGGGSNFDRDLSGFLIGDAVTVPARAGFDGNPRVALKLLGMPDAIMRWKTILACSIPFGTVVPANAALGLRFFVRGSMGNEQITRRCFVRAGQGTAATPQIIGNAQTIYVPARSLAMEAVNPTNRDIVAHYGVDGGTAGFSYWSDYEEITTDDATGVSLDMPAFTRTFTVYSLSTNAAAELRGYNASGTMVYQQVLTAGNSGQIEVDPHLNYTLRSSLGGPFTYSVVYNCLG